MSWPSQYTSAGPVRARVESKTNLPVKASVEVAKINPAVEIIYYGETVLKEKGVEETAVRFSIADDGSVNNVNRNKKSIIVL